MKKTPLIILTVAFFSCFIPSYAQTSKNPLSVSANFSFGGNDLFSSPDYVGGPSYQGKGFYGFETNVSITFLKNLNFITGISFVENKFGKTDAPTGSPATRTNVNIAVYSIPLYLRYNFLKFLYLSGGPVFNLNSGDRDLNGFGVGGSFGAEYKFGNGISISFGPFVRVQGLLPGKNYKLLNSGVNFGIGYKL